MNLFFGKISQKFDKDQIEQGFYQARKDSTWFNGIEVNDYAYAISRDKIQLWQASEWTSRNGNQILKFNIIHSNLEINTKQLTALKFFKLTIELIVLTVRSTAMSKRAFFPIEFDSSFNEFILTDLNTYRDPQNYRNIIVLADGQTPDPSTKDIQLFRENGSLQIFSADFFDHRIISEFRDNTGLLNRGQKNKDITIRKVLGVDANGYSFKPKDLSIPLSASKVVASIRGEKWENTAKI